MESDFEQVDDGNNNNEKLFLTEEQKKKAFKAQILFRHYLINNDSYSRYLILDFFIK